MGEGRVPQLIALGVLVFAAIAANTFASTPPPSPRGEKAAAALVAAWDRKLHGTYVVDQTFTRTLPDGSELRDGSRLVQRPPDRLIVGLGAATGTVGGKIVRCSPVVGQTCSPTADAGPYEDDVAAELATLRSYLEGPNPLYRVTEYVDRGCFSLVLALQVPAPPYGTEALFCFDEATGAPTLTVVERAEGTDRTEAHAIRGQVTDDDLRVPDDKGTPEVSVPDTSSSSSS
jgi:hypothetical protein